MNMQQQQLQMTIEQAEEAIDLAAALQRLHENKDFKKVILEGFFEKEASRAVLLRGDPSMANDKDQATMNTIITTIGGLYQYFSKVFAIGEMSSRSLEADRQTREEIAAEELEELGLELDSDEL